MQQTTIHATSSRWRPCLAGCPRDFPTTTSSNAIDVQLFDIRGTTSLYNPASQDCQQVYLKMKISSVSSTITTDFITFRECLFYLRTEVHLKLKLILTMQQTTIHATSSSWRSFFVGSPRDFPTTTSSNASDGGSLTYVAQLLCTILLHRIVTPAMRSSLTYVAQLLCTTLLHRIVSRFT